LGIDAGVIHMLWFLSKKLRLLSQRRHDHSCRMGRTRCDKSRRRFCGTTGPTASSLLRSCNCCCNIEAAASRRSSLSVRTHHGSSWFCCHHRRRSSCVICSWWCRGLLFTLQPAKNLVQVALPRVVATSWSSFSFFRLIDVPGLTRHGRDKITEIYTWVVTQNLD
jgi:hypothetical protein